MKFLRTFFIALLVVSSFAATDAVYAHGTDVHSHYQVKSQSSALPGIDFSAFANCASGDVLCNQLREQVIGVLRQLIAELLEQVKQARLEQIANRPEAPIEDSADEETEEQEVQEDEDIDEFVLDDPDEGPEQLGQMTAQEIDFLGEGDEITFSLRSDGTVRFSQFDDPKFEQTWDFVSRVIPEEYRSRFDRVTFQNDPNTRFAAHVYQRIFTRDRSDPDAARAEFVLILNLPFMRFDTIQRIAQTSEIIVHELGHLIALGPDQVQYFVDESDCRTYYLRDLRSCVERGSIYDEFSEFWDRDFFRWADRYEQLSGLQQQRELREYFLENRDEHVGSYAATHPDEDLAEAFTEYILRPVPTDNSILSQKIRVFDEFRELRELRNAIRGRL